MLRHAHAARSTMPLRIDRTPTSKRDVFEIWDYVSPHSPMGAQRIIREVGKTITMLSEQPDVGRKRPELGRDIRSFPTFGYLVFYSHTTITLTVVRILHAARDITPDLFAE